MKFFKCFRKNVKKSVALFSCFLLIFSNNLITLANNDSICLNESQVDEKTEDSEEKCLYNDIEESFQEQETIVDENNNENENPDKEEFSEDKIENLEDENIDNILNDSIEKLDEVNEDEFEEELQEEEKIEEEEIMMEKNLDDEKVDEGKFENYEDENLDNKANDLLEKDGEVNEGGEEYNESIEDDSEYIDEFDKNEVDEYLEYYEILGELEPKIKDDENIATDSEIEKEKNIDEEKLHDIEEATMSELYKFEAKQMMLTLPMLNALPSNAYIDKDWFTNSTIAKESVTEIEFRCGETEPTFEYFNIPSPSGTNSLKCYINGTSLILSTPDSEIIGGSDFSYMFSGFSSIYEIRFLGFINSSNIENTQYMFAGCSSLHEVRFGDTGEDHLFNTSNVTNMCGMFKGCSSLGNLDLWDINTNNVTNMSEMFMESYCDPYIGVRLNTSNVIDMTDMFNGCKNSELVLTSFNIQNVSNIDRMFYNCSGLKTILVYDSFKSTMSPVGTDMFFGCVNILGVNGTTYDSSHTDITYARIDNITTLPSYLTPLAKFSINGSGEYNLKEAMVEAPNNATILCISDGFCNHGVLDKTVIIDFNNKNIFGNGFSMTDSTKKVTIKNLTNYFRLNHDWYPLFSLSNGILILDNIKLIHCDLIFMDPEATTLNITLKNIEFEGSGFIGKEFEVGYEVDANITINVENCKLNQQVAKALIDIAGVDKLNININSNTIDSSTAQPTSILSLNNVNTVNVNSKNNNFSQNSFSSAYIIGENCDNGSINIENDTYNTKNSVITTNDGSLPKFNIKNSNVKYAINGASNFVNSSGSFDATKVKITSGKFKNANLNKSNVVVTDLEKYAGVGKVQELTSGDYDYQVKENSSGGGGSVIRGGGSSGGGGGGGAIGRSTSIGNERGITNTQLQAINSATRQISTEKELDYGEYTWVHNKDSSWNLYSGVNKISNCYIYVTSKNNMTGLYEKNLFHFDENGKMTVGWHKNTNGKYYFFEDMKNNDEGKMLFGYTKMFDGNVYYFNDDGTMFTGWFSLSDGGFQYFLPDGRECFGWVKLPDDKWRYFDKDGILQVNCTTPDGYRVDLYGVWVEN